MIRKILIIIAILIVAFCIVVALRPADFRISRSISIAAPPAAVASHVNDLHQWDAWSPWAKLDPNMTVTFGGPPAGEGASYHWVGNKQVGEGKMTIVESRLPDLVRLQLDFIKPLAATSQTEFTFRPEGPGTAVNWTMSGKNNFLAKAVHLVVNMDKMIGSDFEKGLSRLKTVCETPPKG